jgi:hypothetical protein
MPSLLRHFQRARPCDATDRERPARVRRGQRAIDPRLVVERRWAVLTCINSVTPSPSHAVGSKMLSEGTDIALMDYHKKILEWQAANPTITWIGWGIVWATVLSLLFWPSKAMH